MEEIFSLGQWIKRRRKAQDLTQAALAQRIGCSKELIAKIEADARRPSRQIAERLAGELGIAADERALFLQAARAKLAVDQLAPPHRSMPQAASVLAAPPPSGTVTFLFADIDGSALLWVRHPRQMGAAVAGYAAALCEAITAASGVVFRTVGDTIYAAFASALDAIDAAVAGQRVLNALSWELGSPLHARMALHSGLAEVHDGDYWGLPVSRAMHLLAAAHGGQVLLSSAIAELVREQLPPGVTLHDLGSYHFNERRLPEQIFQLGAAGLPANFPPLQAHPIHRNNLPVPSTSWIGRQREIADVAALLRQPDVRLVTLTGPGGIGKTRLAQQVALNEEFADGIWFVNLAAIDDPSLVAATIAQALGIHETSERPLVEFLKSYLREKRILLLLDNFEQVRDAALLVAELLAVAYGLRILVTSRIALHLSGEHVYTVTPLALPDRNNLPPFEQLSDYEAVRLFVERAQAVKAGFRLTTENSAAVAEICYQLDGLPLAIELAATQSRLFAPEALLARLSNRLRLLAGGPHDLPTRQQTLRSTIDWSYQLLGQVEQLLFWQLAVFVGGCTIEAAEAVCLTNNEPGIDTLEGCVALIDHSLLTQIEGIRGEPRFALLETIRAYALERLNASDTAATLRQRHAAYYLVLAEASAPDLVGRSQLDWLVRLDLERDNVRAALAWMVAQHQVEAGLRLSIALRWYWLMRGLLSEGRSWLETLLANSSAQLPDSLRADAQAAAGTLARWQNDARASIPLLEAALHWYQSTGNRAGIADMLHGLGWTTWMQGEVSQSVAWFDASLAHYRSLGYARGIATVLLPRSYLTAHWNGDFAQALTLAEESLRLFRKVGDLQGVAAALDHVADRLLDLGELDQGAALADEGLELAHQLGDQPAMMDALGTGALIAHRRGDFARARMLFEQQLAIARAMGHTRAIGDTLGNLGMVARYQGRLEEAQALLAEAQRLEQEDPIMFNSLVLRQQQGDVAYDQGDIERAQRLYKESLAGFHDLATQWDCASSIERLAAVTTTHGSAARAVRLWGSAAAIREAIHAPLPPVDRPQQDNALARLRTELGAAQFEAIWSAGKALPPAQAIAEALSDDTGDMAPPQPGAPHSAPE